MDNPLAPVLLRRGAALADNVSIVERASTDIAELGADLDRQLGAESRPAERLRLLRASTNRITRTANDAIDAYRKARLAATREGQKPGADAAAIEQQLSRLGSARLELVRVLAIAATRYPPKSDSNKVGVVATDAS